jgi:hypothetical protein
MTERLREKLKDEWGVDFADPASVLWQNVQSFDGGAYEVLNVLALQGDTVRMYRAFPIAGRPPKSYVSVDLISSAEDFAAGESGAFLSRDDSDETIHDPAADDPIGLFKSAVRDEVDGHCVFGWTHHSHPLFSFLARTVQVGGDARVIAGSAEVSADGRRKVTVEFDRPASALFDAPAVALKIG